jgi:hypothetical protein
MENDIQRIEVGNVKFGAIADSVIKPPENGFYFSSDKVTFDQVDQTFDENPIN